MIEGTVLEFLDEKMAVPVRMEVPENPPLSFIVVEKTGSSTENHIPSAMLAIQCYAPTLLEAATLNEELKRAMERIVELDSVSRAELNSDYNFTDTSTKRYRYQAVYELVYF